MQKRAAFTLVELLVSIVLLALIFNYLFSVINSVKKRNEPYTKLSKSIQKDRAIYKLLSLDFINASGPVTILPYKNFDVVMLPSHHSLYELENPTLFYFVSKKDKSLIRIESSRYFDIRKEKNPFNIRYFGDIITKDVNSFKAAQKDGILTLLLRAKGHKDMLISIPTVGKRK